MIYTIEIQIETKTEEAAEAARDELANAAQDAEDSGECAQGTFSIGDLRPTK